MTIYLVYEGCGHIQSPMMCSMAKTVDIPRWDIDLEMSLRRWS